VEEHQAPGVSTDAIRRELLIGSVVEERHSGEFLEEKYASIFYFPHTSFTEFLVADYLTYTDIPAHEIEKLNTAMDGEVITFVNEHPSNTAMFRIYSAFRISDASGTYRLLACFLADAGIREYVQTRLRGGSNNAWDFVFDYLSKRVARRAGKGTPDVPLPNY
jgi:hypothetical protein